MADKPTKYVVTVSIWTDRKVMKKRLRNWLGAVLEDEIGGEYWFGAIDVRTDGAKVTKARVRSVDIE